MKKIKMSMTPKTKKTNSNSRIWEGSQQMIRIRLWGMKLTWKKMKMMRINKSIPDNNSNNSSIWAKMIKKKIRMKTMIRTWMMKMLINSNSLINSNINNSKTRWTFTIRRWTTTTKKT